MTTETAKKLKIEITDWKLLAKIVWKLEMWYQDNYKSMNNEDKKIWRKKLDNLTEEAEKLKNDN